NAGAERDRTVDLVIVPRAPAPELHHHALRHAGPDEVAGCTADAACARSTRRRRHTSKTRPVHRRCSASPGWTAASTRAGFPGKSNASQSGADRELWLRVQVSQ